MTGYDDDLENQDTQFDDIETEAFEDEAGNDSFADTEELGDDLSAEDVWDEDQVADAEAEEQAQPKKKSSLTTFLIIGVIVLAGLGFVFMQFSGGGSTPAETAADETSAQDANSLANLRDQTSLEQQQLAPVATGEEAASVTPPAPQGFMNAEPTPGEAPVSPTPALPESPTMTAVEAPPAVVPPGETLPTAPAPETAAAEPAPVVLEAPKAVSDFPSVDQIKKAPSLEDTPGVPSAETAATPATPGIDPATVAETQDKLDEANSRIAALEQQLAAEKEKATGAISDATGKAQEREQDLKEQLEELQKKLAASERAAALKSQPVAPEPVAELEPEPVKPVKETASIEDRPLSPAPAMTSAAKQVAWELRGAQPGQALLSRKGGEGDIRTVNVGDSLPGLGKIVSIDQSAKGWVVKGTLASVTQ